MLVSYFTDIEYFPVISFSFIINCRSYGSLNGICLIEKTKYAFVAPYIDSVFAIVISLIMIKEPIEMVIEAFKSLVLFAPEEETVDEIIDVMVKKVSRGFECKVGISGNMRNVLHDNANSKYGCRILESMIRENAMQEYLKLLKSDVAVDEYEILIVDVGQTISFPVKSGIVSPKEGEALQAVS